jgi:hypothetical protein
MTYYSNDLIKDINRRIIYQAIRDTASVDQKKRVKSIKWIDSGNDYESTVKMAGWNEEAITLIFKDLIGQPLRIRKKYVSDVLSGLESLSD